MLKNAELESYDILSRYDTNSLQTGQKQSRKVRLHLNKLESNQVQEFEKVYQKMTSKTTCKVDQIKLQTQITAMKVEPNIPLREGSITKYPNQEEDSTSDRTPSVHGAAHRRKASHSIKKESYQKVIQNRNVIGPLETMMQQHQKKVISKIKREEEELQGGKKGGRIGPQKSGRLASMRSSINVLKPK